LSNLLVIDNSGASFMEQEEVLNQLQGWNISFSGNHHPSLSEFIQFVSDSDFYFLLYSQELRESSLKQLSALRRALPLIQIIFYNSQMKSEEFAHLYLAGVDYCIIGDARQFHLIKVLRELWQNHWKRIPLRIIPEKAFPLSPRNQMIINFIETHPVKHFTSNHIAEYLKISESHFRAEFKKAFLMSFREFKQKILYHYESKLLFERKLKPKAIFDVLDYKNISAFSRSFRARHGQSWQQLIKKTTDLNK